MQLHSRRRLWPILLLAVAALGLYAYSTIQFEPEPTSTRPPGGPADIEGLADRKDLNVLFILIDTLRVDRMSAFGYSRETTPFLDKLASTGVRFDRNISQSSWTKSSMASVWSGLFPLRVGISKFDHTVPDQIRMPAEILSEAGFKTVGLYRNGWVSPYFGFDQGFERYYRPMRSKVDPNVVRLRPNTTFQSTDENLLADAVEFLRIHGHRKPWFLYLHLMDLHEYTYDEESAKFGSTVSDIYDNSLLRTDWVLSQLYDYLARTGLTQKTIIVLLSDHGEAFGERGFEGHAREVFPETTETPLIISFPFTLSPGVVVSQRTSNIDIWPTLLDLLGLPDQGIVDGQSRLPEILAAARGESAPEDDSISVAYLDENWGLPDSTAKEAISVVEGRYRYVTGSNGRGHPFEVLLSTEDGQKRDHLAEEPEIAERLRAEAKRQLTAEALYPSEALELDEMQLDQLRALGYELP